MVIQIDKDKNLKLNQDPIEWDKLQDRLEDVFKTRAERVVFVKGDKDLTFETVAHAIDIAKGAGIDKIGLMTPKIEAGTDNGRRMYAQSLRDDCDRPWSPVCWPWLPAATS